MALRLSLTLLVLLIICVTYTHQRRPKKKKCKYNGVMYAHGDSFNSTDGCNTCKCKREYVKCTKTYCPTLGTYQPPNDTAFQQDDLYKEFMTWIFKGGLRYAYAMASNVIDPLKYYRRQVEKSKRRKVIVVGAGMSGLAAAYELAQIGHEVEIVELQSRVGGRVKTIREGFTHGLHSEGGAMRLPPNHYLTYHYLRQGGIEMRPFQNYQPNAYTYIYGHKIRNKDFLENNAKYSHKFWPGWDETIILQNITQPINGIVEYFNLTMKPVEDEIRKSNTKEGWHTWIEKYSKLSVYDFLRGKEYQDSKLKLRPWPEIAITGYLSTRQPEFGDSLVEFLRPLFGQWWRKDLKTPTDGMDTLPRSFYEGKQNGWNPAVNLSMNIRFGVKVKQIKIDKQTKKAHVIGVNTATHEEHSYTGDAVFVTVPLNILRQIDLPLQKNQTNALAGLSYQASTKIMLQCRTRFWQSEVGQGGFSTTDQLIMQFHYPDYDNSGIDNNTRGVLMVYNWFGNALAFGSQSHQDAIDSAVREIAKIHPEILKEFEVGVVQAWYSDPSSQGAYGALKPYEYLDHLKSLVCPLPPIYLAGEILSWSNGWIQGALFSGLTQAYFFQKNVEEGSAQSQMCITDL